MKREKSSAKKGSARNLEAFRKRLLAELKTHQDRVERARRELPVDSDPDDDAGVASRSAYRDFTMGKLERDLQTIIEIERALRRLDAGEYATCVACRLPIADARLNALPWTRTCIQCAGRGSNFAGAFQLTPNAAH
jgi:RNA polymerase-binding transcription factor DksA